MDVEAMHHLLLDQPLIALFAIIACGLLLGKISIKGIQLGTSGVIFVALFAGHIGYSVPDGVETLGLVLFVYCVGIGAGGRFFASVAREMPETPSASLEWQAIRQNHCRQTEF